MNLIDGIRSLKKEHGQEKPLDNLILESFTERDRIGELVRQVTDLANRVRYLEFVVGTDKRVEG